MIRDIGIKTVLNGYVVTVGCQTVVFQRVDDLVRALEGYLSDPDGTEKAYTKLPNAKHTLGLAQATANGVGPLDPREQRTATAPFYNATETNQGQSDPQAR